MTKTRALTVVHRTAGNQGSLGEVIVALGLDNVALAIASAREQFLHGEQPCGPIRDEIVTSWRRSALSGADPDVTTFPYSSDLDLDGRLARAAYPVLDRLAEHLGETKTAVLLADKHARILHRWAADPELHRMMDRSDSAPGFSLIEDVCGTNGLGSVVEERRAMYVRGPEHFAERFISYACYGADHQPALGPAGGRDAGLPHARCKPADDALRPADVRGDRGAPALLRHPARTRVARCVHEGGDERAARSSPSTSGRSSPTRRHRGCSKASSTRSCGSTAAAIAERRPTHGGLRAQPGVEINATFRPLVDGVRCSGRSASSTPMLSRRPRRSGRRRPSPARREARRAVGGCCRSWLHTLDLLERAAGSHEPILLIGEAGSGKPHLARVHQLAGRATTLSVFDAALAQVDGAGVWLRRVKQKFDVPGTLVLRHLEALDQRTALALSSLLEGLEDRSGDRPRSSGCTPATTPTTTTTTGPHVDRIGVHRVVVPPLRERSADIPDLVKAIATGLGTRTSPCRATHCRR